MWRLFLLIIIVALTTGCNNVTDEDIQSKIDKCTAAGMNYTYLKDFRGKPYDVMCVSKRLR